MMGQYRAAIGYRIYAVAVETISINNKMEKILVSCLAQSKHLKFMSKGFLLYVLLIPKLLTYSEKPS